MGYESGPTPIWHFHPRGHITKDDLIKITYDNGSVLYVGKSKERWIVDSALMPKDLQEIRDRHDATNFEIIRYNYGELQSGYVGSPLVIAAYGDDMYTHVKVRCMSVPVVVDISPSTRPTESSEVSPAFVSLHERFTSQ